MVWFVFPGEYEKSADGKKRLKKLLIANTMYHNLDKY